MARKRVGGKTAPCKKVATAPTDSGTPAVTASPEGLPDTCSTAKVNFEYHAKVEQWLEGLQGHPLLGTALKPEMEPQSIAEGATIEPLDMSHLEAALQKLGDVEKPTFVLKSGCPFFRAAHLPSPVPGVKINEADVDKLIEMDFRATFGHNRITSHSARCEHRPP